MKKLTTALAIVLAAAVGVAAVPALAQSAPHVIVRGATPIAPPVFGQDPDVGAYYYSSPFYLYGDDPLDRYYDPAGKVGDYTYHGPKPVDLQLGATLSANNESLLDHMLRCQARHATYNTATNQYFGPNGLPVACYD